jgi:hypothetical protein
MNRLIETLFTDKLHPVTYLLAFAAGILLACLLIAGVVALDLL